MCSSENTRLIRRRNNAIINRCQRRRVLVEIELRDSSDRSFAKTIAVAIFVRFWKLRRVVITRLKGLALVDGMMAAGVFQLTGLLVDC